MYKVGKPIPQQVHTRPGLFAARAGANVAGFGFEDFRSPSSGHSKSKAGHLGMGSLQMGIYIIT